MPTTPHPNPAGSDPFQVDPSDGDPFELDPFDLELDGPPAEPPETSPVLDSHLVGGINISQAAADLVEPAVAAALSKAVAKLATDAVARALTPDVVQRLTTDAEQAAARTLDPNPTPNTDTTAADEQPQLYYGSLDEFVREYLRYMYRRPIDGKTTFWAAAWWQYDEALARLEAIWRAWEHLRLDPATGPSVWWRDHADPHMRALLSPDGPFSKCINTRTSVLEPLPYQSPPDGLFPDVRDR